MMRTEVPLGFFCHYPGEHRENSLLILKTFSNSVGVEPVRSYLPSEIKMFA